MRSSAWIPAGTPCGQLAEHLADLFRREVPVGLHSREEVELEGCNPFRDEFGDVAAPAPLPNRVPRDPSPEQKVDAGLRRYDGELVPQVRGGRHRRERRAGHVDDCRHAPRRRGSGPGLERLAMREAGVVEVDVPVDRARQDEQPAQAHDLDVVVGELPGPVTASIRSPSMRISADRMAVSARRNERSTKRRLETIPRGCRPVRQRPHRLASQSAQAPRLRSPKRLVKSSCRAARCPQV